MKRSTSLSTARQAKCHRAAPLSNTSRGGIVHPMASSTQDKLVAAAILGAVVTAVVGVVILLLIRAIR